MKMRGIIIVDYDIPSGSMHQVSIELERMQEAVNNLVRASAHAKEGTCDIKERRTGKNGRDGLPDLSKVKFRTG